MWYQEAGIVIMADNKKPKFSFKELPIYCKILRIVAAVLMVIGAIWLIIAAIVSINNPYMFGLYFGALSFLIPACAAAIVEFVLEKKWNEKRMAEGGQSQPAPEKKEEPKTTKDGWYCTNCGAYNTGNFCEKCGTKKGEQPKVEKKQVVAEEALVPAKSEPAKVEPEKAEVQKAEEPKKSKKGLIIGLAVGGGSLLLIGAIVGGVFGIKAILNVFSSEGGGTSDSLPSDYKFTVSGTVDYETEDTLNGFVFYENHNVREYLWFHAPDHSGIKIYEIKEGTWTYNQSSQTINVSLDEFQVYPSWSVGYYEEPEQLTFKIKTTSKMSYSSSTISSTIVNKVTTFTNSTSAKYYG